MAKLNFTHYDLKSIFLNYVMNTMLTTLGTMAASKDLAAASLPYQAMTLQSAFLH